MEVAEVLELPELAQVAIRFFMTRQCVVLMPGLNSGASKRLPVQHRHDDAASHVAARGKDHLFAHCQRRLDARAAGAFWPLWPRRCYPGVLGFAASEAVGPQSGPFSDDTVASKKL